jgi:acyl-CoA thioester hydrolase
LETVEIFELIAISYEIRLSSLLPETAVQFSYLAIFKPRGKALQHHSSGLDKHRTTFRVRYAETDQMGVVYYANYLIWMEIGRVELVRSRGFDYKQLEQAEGLFLSVIDANCHYLYPARYDEEIIVQTEVVNSTSRTIEFAYQIRAAASERLLAQGSTRHIWLNREWRPVRLPEQYREVLRIG